MLNNKWAHKAHMPIKRIMQILGFYWEQSLTQRSKNQQMGPQGPYVHQKDNANPWVLLGTKLNAKVPKPTNEPTRPISPSKG
jgi:hypothetical protein